MSQDTPVPSVTYVSDDVITEVNVDYQYQCEPGKNGRKKEKKKKKTKKKKRKKKKIRSGVMKDITVRNTLGKLPRLRRGL